MKSSGQISKPFLAIVITGMALIGFFIWLGLSHRHPSSIEVVSQPETNSVPPVAVAVAAPVSQSLNDGDLPPVIPISLTNVLTATENRSWLKDKDYLRAPHKPQEFGGVEFLMDGMIQLQGRLSKEWKNYNYRTTIAIPLTLTNTIGSLHLLGGTRYGTDEKTFAEIVWHYADGSSRRTPIEYQVQIRDWVRNPYEQPAHLPYAFSKVVWTAPQASQPGHALRLYRTTFGNPEPKKMIRALDFVSDMEDPTLFVVGLTLDPLKPGERPDASPDLEPTDAIPPDKIQIVVQSLDGKPVPQAKLQIEFQQHTDKSQYRSTSTVSADETGAAEVNYPPQNLDQLSISASHDDYGSRKMLWDLKGGDTVPDTYTLKLGGSISIGGIIMDESNSPIAAAKISLYRFWSSEDDSPNKKGDHPDFASQTANTDAEGQWQAKSLPTDLLDHIGFDVKHPDFIGTNITVGANDTVETQLRASAFKIILRRGLDVRGLVTDENDNVISNATVWAGKRNYRDRQETRTGAEGKFKFHNISDGDVVFSAEAKGRAPDSKTLTVKADMADIFFKLSPGHVIRAVVQDENNSPVSGVRVVLEGDGDVGRTYEFSANTDADGRFEWDGAPADPMPFYIGKQGYEDKRNYKLTPDQDNTVTLHKPRQLQGRVLDADTGQPVTKFSVRTGHRQDENSDNVYGVIQNKDFSAADGTFTMGLNEEDDNAVEVSSDDYATKVQSFSDAQNGIVQVTVNLKPSAAIRGVVTSPDGTPLPGVNVAVVGGGPNGNVTLQRGHLRSWNPQTKVATTDADGKFAVGSPAESGTVVAAGDFGFASAPADQVRSSGVIVLQPYGRIEGTMKIGGEPATGKDLMVDLSISGVASDWNSFKTTTDDQGAFTFSKVPPGDVTVVRLIQTMPNSWTHSYSKNIHIDPGQTAQVTLGDDGAIIKGSVRLETPPTDGEALNISGNLTSQMPAMPAFNSSAEAQAFYQSAEGQAQMQQRKNFAFGVAADNSFTIDSVPPGTYTLNISAKKSSSQPWMEKSIAQAMITITVPDDPNPLSPISVGEIVLVQMPQ